MNIVVVGGGTSGWLTAIYAKKIFPEKNIILIESEEYGILGAGEGATPNFVNFLNFLEISIFDLIIGFFDLNVNSHTHHNHKK